MTKRKTATAATLRAVAAVRAQTAVAAPRGIGAPGYENASEMIWKFFKDQSGL